MKATRIRTTARRLDIEIKPDKPVVVLYGPNGAGKSTTLHSIIAAISGTILQGGKSIAAPQHVYRALMDGPGAFRMRLEFDGGANVDRTITGVGEADGNLKCSTKVTSSVAHGLTGKAADGAIAAAIGNPALFDAQAFLALGPADRQARLMSMCATLAQPWTPEEVAERIRAGLVARLPGSKSPTVQFSIGEDESFWDALERCDSTAKTFVRGVCETIDRLQRAIERLDADAAERAQTVHGTAEHWDAQVSRLSTEIEELQREMGRAEQSAARRQSITGEADRLRALAALPVENYEVEMERAAARLAEAETELAAAMETAEPTFTPNPDLATTKAEHDEAVAQIAALRAKRAPLEHVRDTLTATLATLDSHGADECPTCLQAVGHEVTGVLREKVAAVVAAIRATGPDEIRLENAIRFALADIADIETEDHARRVRVARDTEALVQRRARLIDSLKDKGPARVEVDHARAALDERRAVQARNVALEIELQAIGTEDAELTRAQIQGAETQREEARRNRANVTEADERRRTRLRAVADRGDAENMLPLALATAKAVSNVVRDFALHAAAPFVGMLNRMAPVGTGFAVDMSTATVNVALPDRPAIPFVNLSDGEASGLFPALSVALARTSGARWRCVLADRGEAMQSAAAPGAPNGMLVRFVEGLTAAVAADEIDQAFIATARLTAAEILAIEAAGAQVIRLGVDARREDDRATIQTVVNGLTTAGVRALCAWIGVECDSIPMARATAADDAQRAGKTTAEVLIFCEAQPQRARTTTPEPEGASEEANT